MIIVSVTRDGYYVAGENIAAAMKCSPATDSCGKPIFHDLHHTYKVLFLALKEVARKKGVKGDVIVYNDSRIIDELNGDVPPFDDTCRKWHRSIRRELVPSISPLVFFRKKSAAFVKAMVAEGESLLSSIDPDAANELACRIEKTQKEQARSFKGRVLDRFKRMWKNDRHQ